VRNVIRSNNNAENKLNLVAVSSRSPVLFGTGRSVVMTDDTLKQIESYIMRWYPIIAKFSI